MYSEYIIYTIYSHVLFYLGTFGQGIWGKENTEKEVGVQMYRE